MKVRLVKVALQPTFVIEDDDGTLTEHQEEPKIVPAKEWPSYSSKRFPREVAEWEKRLNETATKEADAKKRAAARRAKRTAAKPATRKRKAEPSRAPAAG